MSSWIQKTKTDRWHLATKDPSEKWSTWCLK